jgi:hypothetical protein
MSGERGRGILEKARGRENGKKWRESSYIRRKVDMSSL